MNKQKKWEINITQEERNEWEIGITREKLMRDEYNRADRQMKDIKKLSKDEVAMKSRTRLREENNTMQNKMKKGKFQRK